MGYKFSIFTKHLSQVPLKERKREKKKSTRKPPNDCWDKPREAVALARSITCVTSCAAMGLNKTVVQYLYGRH